MATVNYFELCAMATALRGHAWIATHRRRRVGWAE
jgi:hypothetical protein